MNRFTKLPLVAAAVSLACSLPTFAATNASDNASNPAYAGNTWSASTNGGSGFGTWSFSTSGGGGRYLGSTALSATSFGLYSGSDGSGDGNTDDSSATRQFTGALAAGQTFSVNIAGNSVASTAPGVLGLNFLAGSTPEFTLKFTGGQSNWEMNDGGAGGDFSTGQGYSSGASLQFTFTYNGGESYSWTLGGQSGNGYTATNTISGLTAVTFFDNNQGVNNNFGVNNLSIVPEPSTFMMLVGSSVFGSFYLLRRRRK